MQIAIAGEGELVIRYIDKDGRTLMQERLVVSGARAIQAFHVVPLSLRTVDGGTDVAPVLVSRSNPRQRVTFDRAAPAAFTRKRCKEIGCAAKIGAEAARGQAPAPEGGTGPGLTSEDNGLGRLIASVARPRRR